MKSSLDLGLIGNCHIAALLNERADMVWSCFPRLDGDPVFNALLQNEATEGVLNGVWQLELVDCVSSNQNYVENTAILTTQLADQHGGVIEIIDFAPRFVTFDRIFNPMMLVRLVRRVTGSPRLKVRIRPTHSYGAYTPQLTFGSNHIRYVMPELTLRLTTDASITAVTDETAFFIEDNLTFVFGPDETVAESVSDMGRRFLAETTKDWLQWVRYLNIPFEWQDEVIRAAITLKLNAYDDTGAIVAAVTTSIPEAKNSGRNWDYRFCWLRDGYFTVDAFNRLGDTPTMENYLQFIINVAASGEPTCHLQPVYSIAGRANLTEREVTSLDGYRGMGPVRSGNQAWEQVQHDVYGSAILAATHIFYDRRLVRRGDVTLFRRLEALGEASLRVYDQPDAGLWELRGSKHIHTFSSVMCWAACDRLSRIATQLELSDRAAWWRSQADVIRGVIETRGWSEKRQSYVASFDGESLDASMLLLHELGFVAATDPRFLATIKAIESELKRGEFIFRYIEADDFGTPENAFVVCTFWYIHALAATGRRDEARRLFQHMLAQRNRLGLLSEDVDPQTGEHWGNFPQTYSMVGIITAAIRLSISWSKAV